MAAHPRTYSNRRQQSKTNGVRKIFEMFPTHFLFVPQYYRYTQYFLYILYLSIYICFVLFALYACWLVHFFAAIFHGNMINFHKLVERDEKVPQALVEWIKGNISKWRRGGRGRKTITWVRFKCVCPQGFENSVSNCLVRENNEERRTPKAQDTRAIRVYRHVCVRM